MRGPAQRPERDPEEGAENKTAGAEEDLVDAAYQRGTQSFMGLKLAALPGALVPRTETELLGWTAVERLRREPLHGGVVIDMCCGSGNLGCGIARALPGLRVFATDLTPASVAVAQHNVDLLDLAGRVEVSCGDLFAPLLDRGLLGQVDAVVCNPPYISTGRLAQDGAALLLREPREAFDGGPYGISIHQRVVREAWPFLRPSGWLLFEIGLGQERQVQLLFQRSRGYAEIETQKDATGAVRVVIGRKKKGAPS